MSLDQKALGLDDLNFAYFQALYQKFKNPKKDERPLFLYEKNKRSPSDVTIVYPTAVADDELLKHLPAVHYSDLRKNIDPKIAKNAAIWIKKMQAGSGSSVVRNSHVAKIREIKESEVRIGAKGTDLYVQLENGKNASIAELQILQSIVDANDNVYEKILLHDIISDETAVSIEQLWKSPCILGDKKNYRQIIDEHPRLEYFGKSFQSYIPTIDSTGDISFNRKAPGGHALFGVDALRAAYIPGLRPQNANLVSSIGNGEDLSSSPDEYMVSWMLKEQIPIAMVTTTKTNIDLKGGQIAIVKNDDGSFYISMVEKAQADTAGQGKYFEELGLRADDKQAYFNTNMVLINYQQLSPIITKLVHDIGETEFFNVIAPDLIKNNKKQIDTDGVERTYTQLEGAMGSVMLNLDRYYRRCFGRPLVHFLNVDVEYRTHFFSPIKTAFDFWMQFRSDRFSLDQKRFRLINHRPLALPNVTLNDKFYADVENTFEAFKNAKVLDLKSLKIDGVMKCHDQVLSGDVILGQSV